jgi:large subunit ribosomal protein L1
MKTSKRFLAALKTVDRFKEYSLEDAIKLVKENANAKFDESVEITVNLGVDPKRADQMVRGTVVLPNGQGKTIRVLVLCKPEREEEARKAGADHVGLDEYVEKIKAGWSDVDVIMATPDVMSEVGKLGKLLGPKGLMPNPKAGTVTFNLANAVKEVKAGRVEFRVDKYGILHLSIGKSSFEAPKLKENIEEFMRTVVRMKPPAAKGQYVRGITISSTMGPGVKVDKSVMLTELKG